MDTKVSSLENRMSQAGGAYEMLYNAPGSTFQFPLRPEFSNWRDEQEAWSSAAIFQDMSFHMSNTYVEGRDVMRFLSDFGINKFDGFGPMQAKQYVACNEEGLYVGDAILTCEAADKACIAGKPTVGSWLAFQAERGGYDVVVRTDRASPELSRRSVFRFQIQGPDAEKIFAEVNGEPLPDIPFFRMGKLRVGPHGVTALNHRMSGAAGFEIWGPSKDGEDVKQRIFKAGEAYGLRQIGGLVYPVTGTESGWAAAAIPALYTSASTRAFRQWHSAESFEGMSSIGGSYPRGDMEELYVTPYDLGYGFMIDQTRRFCGSEALAAMPKERRRKKVRLIWNNEDVLDIYASYLGSDLPYKYMAMPNANYSTFLMDELLDAGRRVGFSFYPVLSRKSKRWISLAIIEEASAVDQNELSLIWGEPNGGSHKPAVERHRQKTVRVTVDPQPNKRH